MDPNIMAENRYDGSHQMAQIFENFFCDFCLVLYLLNFGKV